MAKKGPKLSEEQVQAIARAVADPRRFAILQQIASNSVCPCSAVREQQPIGAATISHHMKELSDAGLISVDHQGRSAELTFQREVWDAYLAQLATL
jgi:ArsR family transcriptional regulator